MANLSDFSATNRMKALIYGDSGTGKTCLSCLAPGPVFMFDWDNKISSAYQFLKANAPDRLKDISYEALTTNRVTDDPYLKFKTILDALEKKSASGEMKTQTVVMDSLTLYSEALMAHVLKANPGIRRAMPGVPAMQDYLIAGQYFKSDIGRLLALPCHVICVGHIKREKDETTGAVTAHVMLSGKLAEYAPKVFREVFRAFVRKSAEGVIQHFLQTRADGMYECRTELYNIPAEIPMKMSEILKHFNSEPERLQSQAKPVEVRA